MKKSIKILIMITSSLLIIILSMLIYFLIITSNAKLDKNKLINMERITTYYDINGTKFKEESGGLSVTDLKKMPDHVKNAFISIEDKRFYSHRGVDYRGLFRALINNVKSFSFKEGASTISQQLIKNTHLSNEKTFKRKLIEMKLAKELEKNYSKDEIMEKYLNTIYFGDGCYGITSATKHYFNKHPSELDINESAILASIIKAPSYYSPFASVEKCTKRKNVVLSEMFKQGYITEDEYIKNKNCSVEPIDNIETLNYDFFTLAKDEYNELIKNYPNKYNNFNVYTSFDPNKQQILNNEKLISENFDNSSILINKNGQIIAYNSTCKTSLRQVGSTIKPLLVYAPAIETNAVYSCSPILDEKINFNGYCPSNYNDKYYGYVSVKESLAKSLNSCSVKLLNQIGIDTAKKCINKTNIKLGQNDDSLCLALGATYNGIKLSDIASAYTIFINNGNYISPSCIDKITTDKGEIVYTKKLTANKVFSEETIDIMNDMLKFTVTDGTAKKLSYLDFPIYAKTGTVGNESGNSDAYTISYTSEYVLGTWCGNKNKILMENSITGGYTPALQAASIWEKIYSDTKPLKIKQSDKVHSEYIDKITLDNDHRVILADLYAPKRYKNCEIFKNNYVPKIRSTIFSNPKMETPKLFVNNNEIKLTLCLTEYLNATIYRTCNNKKIVVYDTDENNKEYFIDKAITPNNTYTYSIAPYYKTPSKKIYGTEIVIDTIKIPQTKINDWWKNELE